MLTPRLLLATLALAGCLTPDAGSILPVKGRDDLQLRTYAARIDDGLSGDIEIEIPDDTQSMLIEVRGDKGRYYLSEFNTPRGELVEGGQLTTRFARSVPGAVDWLYPNSPSLATPEPGTYKLLLRGEDGDGDRLSEDVDVRVYTKTTGEFDTCGIHLDFLVDQIAIDSADFETAIDQAVEWVNNLYATQGVRVIDYSVTQISLPNPNFDVSKTATVIPQIDDVLAQARRGGIARNDAVHVVVVRSIGGSEPSGYSMGLPGPLDADRSNAAVLVSTDAYTSDGFLDVEGMASTIAHEVGHYMGLYHTSESGGRGSDPIPDTPECEEEFGCSGDFSANIMTGGGGASRSILTEGQAFVLKHHPLCIPTEFEDAPPARCEMICTAPMTCSEIAGVEACSKACDPEAPMCDTDETCEADDLGKFICRA